MTATTLVHRPNHPSTPGALIVVALLLISLTANGCDSAEGSDVYRESRGQVEDVSVDMKDACLRVVVCVKLKSGDIQYPHVYYSQGHFTSTGFKDVEKPARTFTTIAPKKPFLHLPVTEEVSEYLLLVSKPLLENSPSTEEKDKPVAWSDWHLLRVPAEDIVHTDSNTIVLPSYVEIKKLSVQNEALCRKVRDLYETSAAIAAKRAATPIKSDSEVPEYAR